MRKNFVILVTLMAALGFGWIIHNFISQYPKAVRTRLDDCQTCHRSGMAGTDTEREYSPCGYCHLLQYPNARYKTGVPKSFEDTLNAYGLAYKQQGRTTEALAAIAKLDSDGDKYSNAQEIADLRYPGDSASRPGQPMASIVTLKWNDIRKLPLQNQFMLMNTTSEPFDDYTSYAGVKVQDLLKAAHIDLSGATGITVFAPDGKIPAGILDGKEIPMVPWLLLAFEREGKLLDTAQYEKGTGRLAGEGPYRLVKPQRSMAGDASRPGRPDRSIKSKTFGDGWDFDKALDHNAGSCVRGATVIRVNPMPAGFEEYDWKNGWPLVAEKKLVIFGKGVSKN